MRRKRSRTVGASEAHSMGETKYTKRDGQVLRYRIQSDALCKPGPLRAGLLARVEAHVQERNDPTTSHLYVYSELKYSDGTKKHNLAMIVVDEGGKVTEMVEVS